MGENPIVALVWFCTIIRYSAQLTCNQAFSMATLCYLNELVDPMLPATNIPFMTGSYAMYLIMPLLLVYRLRSPLQTYSEQNSMKSE